MSLLSRFVLALLLAVAAFGIRAEDYTLGPDSQPHDGVPKGAVTKFILAPGKDYPGTPHNCALYVPAQYEASKPTPFMIFLDGSQALGDSMRVPVVLDNLIAKHDLPPMIAIFVDPGILPAVSDADQNRYNRIFEYDSLTPRFSDFLLSELIPEVAKTYNLSQNPDDRGLSGVSTGAVGAFAAAWNRPDQFHRVLSLIGTYVSMKGADALPALVRKTEPKPIRIFMQDGTADHIVPAEPYGVAFAGSWPINNQVMYEALEFAGYDVKLAMGTEGHNLKQGGAILPDALRWLWRDYPAPVVVHEPPTEQQAARDPSASVFSTVFVDKPWQLIDSSDSLNITSITSDREGNVYAADPDLGTVERVGPDGKVSQLAGLPKDTSVVRIGAYDRSVQLLRKEPRYRIVKHRGRRCKRSEDRRPLPRKSCRYCCRFCRRAERHDLLSRRLDTRDSHHRRLGLAAVLRCCTRRWVRAGGPGAFARPVHARGDGYRIAL